MMNKMKNILIESEENECMVASTKVRSKTEKLVEEGKSKLICSGQATAIHLEYP